MCSGRNPMLSAGSKRVNQTQRTSQYTTVNYFDKREPRRGSPHSIPRPVSVRPDADRLALGMVSLRSPAVSTIPPTLHAHFHLYATYKEDKQAKSVKLEITRCSPVQRDDFGST